MIFADIAGFIINLYSACCFYDNIVYPLTDLGWGLGESIIPVLYTKKEWDSMAPMPFYQNVEQDKRILA